MLPHGARAAAHSCLYITLTHKDEHNTPARLAFARFVALVSRERKRERATEGWKGGTQVKATEMPSQPEAISCGQAAGTIIGCSKGPCGHVTKEILCVTGNGKHVALKLERITMKRFFLQSAWLTFIIRLFPLSVASKGWGGSGVHQLLLVIIILPSFMEEQKTNDRGGTISNRK